MTEEQRVRAVHLREQEWTWRAIGAELGLNASWLSRVVGRWIGPSMAAHRQRPRQALAMREAGISYDEIAEELGYADAAGACRAVSKIRVAWRRRVARPPVPHCPTCGTVLRRQAS